MTTWRYVGNPDFHDGHIRAVSRDIETVTVTVEGTSGKHYTVIFDGVTSLESHLPKDMMLHALSETELDTESLRRYDFINWYVDEPKEEDSKAYLRITAKRFTLTVSE